MMIIPVRAEFTYDATTETNCWFDENNIKHCWKALYSGYSPTFFKEVISKESNWLKFYNVVYLERDANFDILIKSFNATNIDFALQTTDALKSETLPLKFCNYEYDKKTEEEIEVCYQINYKLNAVSRDFKLGLNPLNFSLIRFGLNSTTIMLQDADSENLEDTWLDAGNNNNYGDGTYFQTHYYSGYDSFIIKFNISSTMNMN